MRRCDKSQEVTSRIGTVKNSNEDKSFELGPPPFSPIGTTAGGSCTGPLKPAGFNGASVSVGVLRPTAGACQAGRQTARFRLNDSD